MSRGKPMGKRLVQQQQRHFSGTLQEHEVARIKKLLQAGDHSRRDIAHAYEVGLETIARIARGDTWAWVLPEGQEEQQAEIAAALPAQGLQSEADRILARLAAKGLLQAETEAAAQNWGLERLQAEASKLAEPARSLEEFMKKPESLD